MGADKKKKMILLVEDEVLFALEEERIIRGFGYDVTVKHGGDEAIEAAAGDAVIDLVIMDIDLGGGTSGPEAARRILERRRVPIVFLASRADRGIIEQVRGILHYGLVIKNSGDLLLQSSIEMAFDLFDANKTGPELTETALRENEYRNRMIFENINQGIFLSTLEGTLLQVNPAAAKIAGYDSIEELLLVPSFRFYVDPADRDRLIGELLEKGSVRNREILSIKKNGTIYWLSLSVVIMKNTEGAPSGIIGFVEEITDRRQGDRLIAAERDLGLALAGTVSLKEAAQVSLIAALSVAEMDSGAVFLVNDAGGFDPIVQVGLSEEFLDKLRRFTADSLHTKALCRGEPVFLDDSGITGGEENRSPSGALSELMKREGLNNLTLLPVHIQEEVLACIHIASHTRRAITHQARMALEGMTSRTGAAIHRIKTQEELKFSEEKFLRSFMHSPAVLCIARLKDFKIIDINDTFMQKSGYTREEVINKTAPELLVWDNPANRDEAVAALMTVGQISGKEYGFRTRDGRIYMGEYSAFIITIAGEKHILVTIVDITERKNAEDKIRALLAEKETLLREVHHRIKNNMGTMMSLLSLQADTLQDQSAVNALLEAKSRIQSMSVLYDSLYQTEHVSEMSVGYYLKPLLDRIASLFPVSASVRIDKHIDDFILNVKTLLPLGIMTNELVTNAMKYAFTGRESGVITVTASEQGDHATLVIEDDGTGIPESVDCEHSSGFGLRLVDILTHQISGSITIERSRGTRFVITFPVTQ